MINIAIIIYIVIYKEFVGYNFGLHSCYIINLYTYIYKYMYNSLL